MIKPFSWIFQVLYSSDIYGEARILGISLFEALEKPEPFGKDDANDGGNDAQI